MKKHLLTSFFIFGFFIANAQDRQGNFRTTEARFKSLNLVDFPSPNGRMDNWISNENSPSFRGAIKYRLDRLDLEELDSTGTLAPNGNISYAYNANNQITQYSNNSHEVSTGIYSPPLVRSYTYENNKNVQIDDEKLNINTGQLVKSSRIKMYYNSKGLLSQLDYDVYDTTLSEYKPDRRDVRYYDTNDRIVKDTIFIVNKVNGLLEGNYRNEYNYNALGLQESWYAYSFDPSSSTWQIDFRGLLTYNANNFLVQNKIQSWDANQSIFKNALQDSAIYDIAGGMKSLISQDWSSRTNTWVNYSKDELINDNNFNRADLLIPSISNNVISGFNRFNKMLKIDSYFEWDFSNSTWVLLNKTTFIYSEQVFINTEDTKLEGVSFYPNPVESSLSIRNQKGAGIFELFNVQGQKIIHQEVVGDAQVDLSQQMPGFYFYKMTIGGKSATGKLVKN
jgi:hypothetical protein